jgi:hypothetical protein
VADLVLVRSMTRLLDRCVGPLLIFTAGFAFIAVALGWIRRAVLVVGFSGQREFISASTDPRAFWGYVLSWICVGTFLVGLSVYLGFRLLQVPEATIPVRSFPRSGLILVVWVSCIVIIAMTLNFLAQ